LVEPVTVAPRSVLLIDDDVAIRDALTELLVDEGFAVHSAVNGREALDWLHQVADPPDAILLDLMMPVMDGRTLLRVRKAEPLLLRIPLLVFSADRTDGDLATDPDIDGILAKPVVVEDLLDAIDRCTSGRPLAIAAGARGARGAGGAGGAGG
jgi:CheY-like chemotaxis protein